MLNQVKKILRHPEKIKNYNDYVKECLFLLKHCYLYYELDRPEISDLEYDIRYKDIHDYENENPKMPPLSFSPTQFAGFSYKLLNYVKNEIGKNAKRD